MRPDWSGLYTTRGVKALDTESGTVLWLSDGTTITVHARWDDRPAAVAALISANHQAIGVEAVEAGEPLEDFRRP
jgi:hypothetical protein